MTERRLRPPHRPRQLVPRVRGRARRTARCTWPPPRSTRPRRCDARTAASTSSASRSTCSRASTGFRAIASGSLARRWKSHPVWVDDPSFNIRYHVRHTRLPRPGSERQLKRLVGRIFSQRLDREKPLWELWVIEGLEGDRIAVTSKVHHCMVDGVSGSELIAALLTTEPQEKPDPVARWQPRPLPSRVAARPGRGLARARARRARSPRRSAGCCATRATRATRRRSGFARLAAADRRQRDVRHAASPSTARWGRIGGSTGCRCRSRRSARCVPPSAGP